MTTESPLTAALTALGEEITKRAGEYDAMRAKASNDRQRLEALLASPAFDTLREAGLTPELRQRGGKVWIHGDTGHSLSCLKNLTHNIAFPGVAVVGVGFVVGLSAYSAGGGVEFCPASKDVIKDPEAIAARLLQSYTKSITPKAADDMRERLARRLQLSPGAVKPRGV